MDQDEKYDKIRDISKSDTKEEMLVKSRKTNKIYIHKIYIYGIDDIKKKYNELKIIQSLNHPNIIKFHEIFKVKNPILSLNILYEYVEGGSLYNRIQIQKNKKEYFTESQILNWFTQICLGLNYIHSKKYIHRNLKTKNIFLTKNDQIKIGKFANAKKIESTIQNATKLIEETSILAPELIEQKPYTNKIDVWSLGIILYELMTFKKPFEIQSLSLLFNKIKYGDYPDIKKLNYSKNLINLIGILLNINPDLRPSVNNILSKFLLMSLFSIQYFKKIYCKQ